MDISVIGSSSIAAATSASSSAKTIDTPATTTSAPASPAPASDTVTLSPAAQQAVAGSSTDTPSLADTLFAKAAATTDKGLAQFYGLAATVVDTSGQYTPDQQLDAYLKFNACSPNWQTSLPDWQGVYTAVTRDSSIARISTAVADAYNAAAMTATQNPDTDNDQGIAQAKRDAAAAMSDFDRKVLFETKVNASYSGSHYADEDAWVSALQDQASGNAVSPSAQNYKTLYSLVAVINDATGKYSQDDQLNAYVEFMKNSVFLQWKDLDGSALQLASQVGAHSPIAQLAMDTYSKVVDPAVAQYVLGDPDSGRRAVKAELDAFNTLSDFDKKVFFETQVNEVLQNRGHPYASMQQWLDEETAFANGGTGQTATAQSGAGADGTANQATDADKALATLKAYAAGQATKTDRDKALAALKESASGGPDDDAALLLLKNAARTRHPAASAAASETTSTAPSDEAGTTAAKPSSGSSSRSAFSLTA
jgi:hypothetical protein